MATSSGAAGDRVSQAEVLLAAGNHVLATCGGSSSARWMDDWNGDGCVSDYLHTIHDRRIVKNNGFKEALGVHSYTKTYGGQFHFDVYGLQDTIIGLDGFAGQQILINVNDERILVINSKYKNYDWEEIVYQEI